MTLCWVLTDVMTAPKKRVIIFQPSFVLFWAMTASYDAGETHPYSLYLPSNLHVCGCVGMFAKQWRQQWRLLGRWWGCKY